MLGHTADELGMTDWLGEVHGGTLRLENRTDARGGRQG